MHSTSIDPGLARNPLVVISRFRGYPTRRVAARVRLLFIATRMLLPADLRFSGNHWQHAGCELFEILHPDAPNSYAHLPIDGRVTEFDVIFAAAGFARIFGLETFDVEVWLWTGERRTVEEVLRGR